MLGLVIAEALFNADSTAREGLLAPRFNALVRRETCTEVACSVNLSAVLKIGRSEMLSGNRSKDALLADAIEAVIAAIYLDSGFESARLMILRLWQKHIDTVEVDSRDAKTILQEWAQAQGLDLPCYTEIKREGPDHAPLFTIQAEISPGRTAEASANSKRNTEQAAAKALLAELQITPKKN